MVQVGSYTIIDRHNRPNVSQRVVLRAFFINDGVYQDPVSFSGVTIVPANANVSPSGVLNSDGLITGSLPSSEIRYHYSGVMDASAYSVSELSSASSIYKLGTGKYAVVLDGTSALSGAVYEFNGSSLQTINKASGVGEYLDLWTVQLIGDSDYKTVINDFRLYADTFFTITQPLILKSTNRLVNKHMQLGSKETLKFTTEVSVENRDIDHEVKNLFKDSVITSAMVEISKINDATNLPSRTEVSGYSDTSALVDITSDNTILFTWDTEQIKNLGTASEENSKRQNIGSPTGTYAARVKYNLIDQTIVSPLFHFIVN